MTAAISQVPLETLKQLAVGGAPPLEQLTLEQVEEMIKHGILKDGEPIELIDGLLVRKDRRARGEDLMTHNPAHAQCVSRLMYVLMAVQAHDCHLRCQLPIALLPTRAPEPDVSIIRGTPKDYGERHPGPNDVVAVFEVADSSLDFDRSTKQRLYATAGIATYWIVNLVDQVIEVYESPDLGAGKFGIHGDYSVDQTIELPLRPNVSLAIRVSDILG